MRQTQSNIELTNIELTNGKRVNKERKLRIERLSALALGLFVAPNTFAYLDPGTGSMIIQGLIAAIAMVSITARMYWYKLKSFFGVSAPSEDADVAEPTTETER